MCGIAGVIGKKNNSKEIALKMAADMTYRGPDDIGVFSYKNKISIAAVRLGFVDIKNNIQPMTSLDGRHSIVFNGEIYNFRELRSELEAKGHHFQGWSDTEVLLALYHDQGLSSVCENESIVSFLRRLNGIFSFALWDNKLKSLLLARDALGVKPLYIQKFKDNIHFASEIKAFKPFIDLRPSTKELSEFCCFGETSSTKTIYENIYQIEPGHYLEISLNDEKKLIVSGDFNEEKMKISFGKKKHYLFKLI